MVDRSLQSVGTEMRRLSVQSQNAKDKAEQVSSALFGIGNLGMPGLLSRLEEIEKKLDSARRFFMVVSLAAGVINLSGLYVLWRLVQSLGFI